MKKSIFLFFAAILCAIGMNAAVPSKIYLDASGWGYSDARYAAYFMPQNSFVDMTKATGEVSVFEVAVPADQTGVIFVRMNGATTENKWDNKWNQTGYLTIPTDGKNMFKPSDWNDVTTTWSTYTYTPPTFYIAGDFVTPNWSCDDAANKMDCADGVYSKSYDNVAASAHQFKITNGTWYNAIGYNSNTCSGTNCKVENNGGNIQFTPVAEGTVTITYTLADGKVHITCPEPPAAEYNIAYPATQTNYTLTAGPAKAQAGAEVSFTATPADGYVLNVTYNGNVITGNDNVYAFLMPAADVTIAIEAVAATTLYYVDNNSWGSANAYMWDDNGNNVWPGVAMTKVGTVGDNNFSYYSVSFAQGTYVNIIFNNGSGSQTSELTINTEKPYFYDGAWYTWDELLAKLAAPVVTYDYYIAGPLAGGWSATQMGMEKVAEGQYACEFKKDAGDYQFKVTNGKWGNEEGGFDCADVEGAYEEVSNVDGNVNVKLTATTTFTVKFNATDKKITFEGLTPVTATLTYKVKVPAGTEKCFIAGPCGSWDFKEMTLSGETDIFTIDIVGAKETDEYKYACQADWAYAEVIEGGGNRTAWSELDEVTAWNKPVVYTYYLMGVNDDWATGIEMEVNADAENEVMLTCQPVNGEVKIKRVGDDSSEYWYGGNSLKTDEGNLGTNTSTDGGDGNIKLEDGIYNFYFNTADGKLWIATCTPTEIDVTLSGMVKTPVSRMGSYRFLSLDDEAGNQLSIMNGSEETYGDFEVTGYLADYSVSVAGNGTWAVVDGVETLTATLQVEDDHSTIYHVTATVAALQTFTINSFDATYTIDPEYGDVTFIGTEEEGGDFEIVVGKSYEGLYAYGVWNGTDIMATEITDFKLDLSDETYMLCGTFQDEAGNTYEVFIMAAPAVVEPELPTIELGDNEDNENLIKGNDGKTVNVKVNRSFTANDGYYTICVPFNMPASVIGTAYILSGINAHDASQGFDVNFTQVQNIEAGKPYLVLPSKNMDGFTVEGVTIDATTTNNKTVTAKGAECTIVMQGMYYANTTTNGLYWVGNDGYLYNDDVTLLGLRAYFAISTPSGMPPRMRVVANENVETGVEDIFSTDAPVKTIENGQLIIIRDGVKYNVQGQMVK